MSAERQLIHAYGVLEADGATPTWPSGIADTSVSTTSAGKLVAVISQLPSSEFDPATWDRHADDAAWLGNVAFGHHRVLQAAVSVSDVVPFRLPSLYGDMSVLRQSLADSAELIDQVLDRIRGHVEWSIKLFRVDDSDDVDTETEPARTGSDYLISRSREKKARAETNDLVRSRCHEAFEQIRQVSTAAARNAPQDPVLSGRREPMVLNAAFLVERTGQHFFREMIEEVGVTCGSEDLQLEASGPWPPYNFAAIADAGS
jgi:hypothetical protein